MFKFAIVLLLAVLCRTGFAQEEFPFKEAVFQGASGFRPGSNFEYFLIKRAFLRGVPEDEEAALIAEWTRQHPNAKLVPVSILGEKSRHPIVYFWAIDGQDNLNLFLVSKGVYPALTMLDTVQFDKLKRFPYGEMLEARERMGNPTGAPSRRLISDERYRDFLERLVAAETAAQIGSNGIWSDQFKPVRDKMGFTPLGAVPLSLLYTEGK